MAIVRTVLGDISPEELGVVLPHEHTIFSWSGAEADYESSYDREKVLHELSQELKMLKESHGVSGLVDVTTTDAGRDIEFMAELSRRSGVHIIAATGLYTESMGIPYYWRLRPIEALERHFIRELTEGVVNTNIKCGVIKIASGPLLGTPCPEDSAESSPAQIGITAHEERVFRAAARVQKRLGVAITTHTDPYDWAHTNIGASQLDILEEEGADLSRCIIGHADGSSNIGYLAEIIERGASVGIDTIGYPPSSLGFPSDDVRLGLVTALVAMGYASNVLLSYDRTFFQRRPPVTEAEPFSYNSVAPGMLFEEFIPRLLKGGVSKEAVHQMTVENPQRIFASSMGKLSP